MADKTDDRDLQIARRRWRNMMLAALANERIPKEQRDHLEKMRRRLGIPLKEASRILDEYRAQGAKITLFGNRAQQIALFRDMLTMVLADGVIDDAERKLVIKLANKLEIGEDELDRHIEDCKRALEGEDPSASARISHRVFRRLRSKDEEDENGSESARRQRVELFDKMASLAAKVPLNTEKQDRFDHVVREDEKIAEYLIKMNVVTAEQVAAGISERDRDYRDSGRIASCFAALLRSEDLAPAQLATIRAKIFGTPKVVGEFASEDGGFKAQYWQETVDHTYYVSVIRVAGQVDSHSNPLFDKTFAEVMEQAGSAGKLMVLDLSDVAYMSSAAIGTVIEYRARAVENWGDLRFVGMQQVVAEVMKLLGVATMIRACDTVQEALISFGDFSKIVDS